MFRGRLEVAPAIQADLIRLGESGLYDDAKRLNAFRYTFDGGLLVDVDLEPAHAEGIVIVDEGTDEDRRRDENVLVLAGLSLHIRDLSVTELICVQQSALVPPERRGPNAVCRLRARVGDTDVPTLNSVLSAITSDLGKASIRTVGPYRCLEVRDVEGYEVAASLIAEHPACCYGLLTCDEGWAYVPDDRIHAAVDDGWATRDYIRVLAMPRVVASFTLTKRRAIERAESEAAVERFAGLTLLHAHVRSRLAGLEHGVLLAFASTAGRRVIARDLWYDLRHLQERRSLRRWRERGKLRRRLIDGLLRLSTQGVTEIAALQTYVDRQTGLTEVHDRLRDVGQILDADLREQRAFLVNVGVAILAVAAVIAAVVQILVSL